MRYVFLILGLALAACSNGEAQFGQFGQQTVAPEPFRITFPAEGGVAGTRPQIRWTGVPGVGVYELSVWRNASLTDLADFQRVAGTEAVVRVPLTPGSTAFAEVRAKFGFQTITTGIVSFTVGGVPLLPGPAEGNRLASLAGPQGAALALLDPAGNAVWLHIHPGPGAILDARLLPHGVVYLTGAGAREVAWDGLPLWEGPAGSFVDGPGKTSLVDSEGAELGAWPSGGPGLPAEAVSPLEGYEVLWAVVISG